MDFEPPSRVRELKGRIDDLIEEVIEPLEAEHADWLGGGCSFPTAVSVVLRTDEIRSS